MSQLAPIALFVYNRPHHTRQCLESLMQNVLADQSTLYIFADGPKDEVTRPKVEEVRALIREKQWCGKVEIREAQENRGLVASIMAGVTELLHQHHKVIVLEDDLESSRYFLTYMNEGLTQYAGQKNVYSVNGYMFPFPWEDQHSVLLPTTSSWGWATWADRWAQLDIQSPQAKDILNSPLLKERFNIGHYDYAFILGAEDINSWAIKWYYTVFERNGLGVFPTVSLIRNLGMDGSGAHIGEDLPAQILADGPVPVLETDKMDLAFYARYLEFFTTNFTKPSAKTKLIGSIKRMMGM